MLKFLIKLPFRILFLPILLTLKILFWVCSGILCLSEWMFSLAGTVLLLLGLYSLIFEANMQGLAVILIAFLVSPFGLPLLAMKLVFLLGSVGDKIKEIVY
ncbi:MAG: succinate dehydrogenase [Clostridia bacterium]|nr:succinate dehydrogenase [Clostridia bacterium]